MAGNKLKKVFLYVFVGYFIILVIGLSFHFHPNSPDGRDAKCPLCHLSQMLGYAEIINYVIVCAVTIIISGNILSYPIIKIFSLSLPFGHAPPSLA